jgi:hypothetical protein
MPERVSHQGGTAGLYNAGRPAVAGRCDVSFAVHAVTRVFSLAAALGTLSLAAPALG